MNTKNIQTNNSLRFGAKLQISRRTCVRGKKFIDKELTNQYIKKAEGIGTSKDLIKFDIGPLYRNDDKHIGIRAQFINHGGKIKKQANYENGPAFNVKELKEYVNMIISGTLDECKRTHSLIILYRWFDYFGQLVPVC